MRILVTGSREFVNYDLMKETIQGILNEFSLDPADCLLVHGGAPGADRIAGHVAEDLGIAVEPHPANWKKYGKSAGPKRNKEMVDLGADICLAFPQENSIGTIDCMKKAEAAGIEVRKFDDESAIIDT